jgi:hypothetical protein
MFRWGRGQVQACIANEKLDIGESKWCLVIVCVFARVEEEEES